MLSKIRALGGKRVAKPSAKQVKEAKPISAVKVPTRPTSGPATRGGRRGRKDLKPERKVAPGASKTTGKPSALPKAKPKPDRSLRQKLHLNLRRLQQPKLQASRLQAQVAAQ